MFKEIASKKKSLFIHSESASPQRLLLLLHQEHHSEDEVSISSHLLLLLRKEHRRWRQYVLMLEVVVIFEALYIKIFITFKIFDTLYYSVQLFTRYLVHNNFKNTNVTLNSLYFNYKCICIKVYVKTTFLYLIQTK